MPGVRNGPLVKAHITQTGLFPIGSPGPNWTWLVKAVHVLSQGAATQRVVVALTTADSVVQGYIVDEQLDAAAHFEWYGVTGLAEDDLLQVYCEQLPTLVWVFGAALPGVADLAP